MLSAHVYSRLFTALDRLMHHYDHAPSVASLVASLEAELRDVDISRDDIEYVLEALRQSGYRFQQGKGSAATLVRYYATWVLRQCRESDSELSNQDFVRVYHWLTSGVFAPATAVAAVQ